MKKIFNFITKNILFLCIILIAIFYFYWFEYRPYFIKSSCFREGLSYLNNPWGDKYLRIDEQKNIYKGCIMRHGF